MIRGSVREIKELREEIEQLRSADGIPEKEYYDMMSDKDRQVKILEEENKKLEQKLESQRKHFEAMRVHDRKEPALLVW